MADEGLTIIIDNGTDTYKAGFGGDETPCSVFPSVVAEQRYIESVWRMPYSPAYIGDDACARTSSHIIHYPFERGIPTKRYFMEKIYYHIFYDQLRVDPTEHPVILTEVPMNTKANREKMVRLMFETFNVPSLYIGIQAVLSLYSSDRTTGIVFDSGDGISQIVPIYEGFSLQHAVKSLNLAGRDLTSWLQKILKERGYTFNEASEKKIARDIKEKHAYVALDYDVEQQKAKESSENDVSYTLPDGQIIKITDERFRCPELLFKPCMNGFEFGGIDQTLFDSIMMCDKDIHKDLYKNIVVSGGSTMFEGLPQRVEKEIIRLAPESMKVNVFTPPERRYAAWIGGSILATIDAFPQMVITREEYFDVGTEIVHRKCF